MPSHVQIKIKPKNNKKGQKVTTFTKHSYEMRQNLGLWGGVRDILRIVMIYFFAIL